jgi:GDP-L-fucose synthase
MDLAGKRVTVTGGAGFLGSHIVDVLKKRGAQVRVVHHDHYDLTKPVDAFAALVDQKSQVVIHCAAKSGGIGANCSHPAVYFYENLLMGTHIIHEAHRVGVEKLVLIGTVCSYPKHTIPPFHEDDIWNGYPEETNAPYGLAKKMLLVQADAYRREHGLNAIVLLPVNMYGPRDDFDLETSHVIPALIRKIDNALENGREEVELWGDGTATREFLYVEDAAEAIVRATERYDGPDPVNIGSGEEVTVLELAMKIRLLMTDRAIGFKQNLSRPSGQPRRILDVSRAAERFGFRAQTSLVEGLKQTIAWYRSQS